MDELKKLVREIEDNEMMLSTFGLDVNLASEIKQQYELLKQLIKELLKIK